ncbi:hypothetical protein NC653_026538 [Populus alba x Populus x berolinensis]|uniref:Uncharacterized protein n=1 Tax=Populus alba x Populus x berolinensis TaxID=444605 RepID=A0AAD6ME22_9ROSI|nr:hypothetical protein NC653_026538 [Populus alba x Populus x berolinensis]
MLALFNIFVSRSNSPAIYTWAEAGLSMGIQGNGVAEESSQWQPSSITRWQNPVGLCCRELYHWLYFFVYTFLDLLTSKRACHPNCDRDLICWRIFWVHSLLRHVVAR